MYVALLFRSDDNAFQSARAFRTPCSVALQSQDIRSDFWRVFDSVGTAVVDYILWSNAAGQLVCALASQGMGHWGTCPPDFQQFSFFQFTLLTPDSNFVRLPLQICIVFVICNNIAVVVQYVIDKLYSPYNDSIIKIVKKT